MKKQLPKPPNPLLLETPGKRRGNKKGNEKEQKEEGRNKNKTQG